MAENELINKKKKTNQAKSPQGPSLFSQLEAKLTFEWLFEPANFSKYFLRFGWFVLLGVVYIYNTHTSERLSREYDALTKQVEDKKTLYTTLHSDVMFQSKESEVIKKVKVIGLVDDQPPMKIVVQK